MLQRIAKSIVRRYPAAWRRRYEEEVVELLDIAPVRPFDVGELFRNMLVEQARATLDIERPSETAAKVMRYKTVAIVTAVAICQTIGWGLLWVRPISEGEALSVLAVAGTFWIVLFVVWAGYSWRERSCPRDERAAFPAWLALAFLPLHLAAAGLFLWADLSLRDFGSGLYYFHFSMQATVSMWLMVQIWPGQRLVQLMTEFQMADGAVESARRFVLSCEEWIAKGVPSPLADAEAALQQRIRERDVICDRLGRLAPRTRLGQTL